MAKQTVYDELVGTFKVQPKKGEDTQDFLRRLIELMDAKFEGETKLKGDKKNRTYNGLTGKAQRWFNDGIDEIKAESDVSIPAGMEIDEPEDEEDEDEKPKGKKAKSNGHDKSAKAGKDKGKKAKSKSDDDEDEADEEDEDEDDKKSKGKKAKGKDKEKSGKKGKGKGSPIPRAARFKSSQTIKLLVKKNPKKEGTDAYDRFEHYFSKKCKTVGDATKLGLRMGDLAWDSDPDRKGGPYIKIV